MTPFSSLQLTVKKILYIQLKTSWDIKLHVHPKSEEFWLSVSVFPLEIAHTTLNTQVTLVTSPYRNQCDQWSIL